MTDLVPTSSSKAPDMRSALVAALNALDQGTEPPPQHIVMIACLPAMRSSSLSALVTRIKLVDPVAQLFAISFSWHCPF